MFNLCLLQSGYDFEDQITWDVIPISCVTGGVGERAPPTHLVSRRAVETRARGIPLAILHYFSRFDAGRKQVRRFASNHFSSSAISGPRSFQTPTLSGETFCDTAVGSAVRPLLDMCDYCRWCTPRDLVCDAARRITVANIGAWCYSSGALVPNGGSVQNAESEPWLPGRYLVVFDRRQNVVT